MASSILPYNPRAFSPACSLSGDFLGGGGAAGALFDLKEFWVSLSQIKFGCLMSKAIKRDYFQ